MQFHWFLASVKNKNPYFQYSGYSFALRYCLSNWSVHQPQNSEPIAKNHSSWDFKNYQESEDFWKAYESPIETGFKIFYDNFLKINQQKTD